MYNPLIVDHFSNPRNVGEIENPDAEIVIDNPMCGDKVDLHINWDETRRISEVRFQAHGCATAIATASIFGEHIRGKTIREIAATPEDLRSSMLGDLEPPQRHCLDILRDLFAKVQEAAGPS